MRSYDSFQHKSDEKTWLTRIAINCCKSAMRTRWFKMVCTGHSDDTAGNNVNQIEELLEKESLTDAMRRNVRAGACRKTPLKYYKIAVASLAVLG